MNTDKDALRARLRTKRAGLPDAFRRLSADTIAHYVLKHPDCVSAQTVGLYAAMGPPHCEVQTDGLHTALHERGCALAYPRIGGNTLEFALVRNAPRDLAPGPWKLREPKPHCELISIEAIDVLIVPGVAFTPYGERLGQGGGYYDRVLADSTFSGCSIGLCFQDFVLPNLPTNSWDQRVDWIATEDGLVAATTET